MSRRQYPRIMTPEHTGKMTRPGIKKCDTCKKVFQRTDRFVIQETQVNWFRGDDEVAVFCLECWAAKKGAKP